MRRIENISLIILDIWVVCSHHHSSQWIGKATIIKRSRILGDVKIHLGVAEIGVVFFSAVDDLTKKKTSRKEIRTEKKKPKRKKRERRKMRRNTDF